MGWASRRRASPRDGPRAERTGLVQRGQRPVLEHGAHRLVDARERHGEADRAVHLLELRQVDRVGAVRAVLVLDLHEDDGPAGVDLPRDEHGGELLQVGLDGCEEAGLVAADPDGAVGEEPVRQTAVRPLGADVGTGADDGVHALGGDEVEEAAEVEPAGEVEDAGRRSVRVPGDVGLDGVEPHQLRLADPVGPQVGVDAEVVDRAGQDPVRLAVEQEVGVADGEAHGGTLSGDGAVRKDPHGPGSNWCGDYLDETVKPWSSPYFARAFCHAASPLSSEVPFSYDWPTVSA